MSTVSEAPSTAVAPPTFSQILGQLEFAQISMQRGRLVGLCGCRSGDGTTFVIDSLARDLARSSRKRVLVADAGHLLAEMSSSSNRLLSLCTFTKEPGIWKMQPGRDSASSTSADDSPKEDALSWLTAQFQFVLIDLGAVSLSAGLWHLAPALDELLLVVAAGQTRRSQITYAQRLVDQAHGRLTGCVLNRRTYPLPRALYEALK